jgi:hypothetical protein
LEKKQIEREEKKKKKEEKKRLKRQREQEEEAEEQRLLDQLGEIERKQLRQSFNELYDTPYFRQEFTKQYEFLSFLCPIFVKWMFDNKKPGDDIKVCMLEFMKLYFEKTYTSGGKWFQDVLWNKFHKEKSLCFTDSNFVNYAELHLQTTLNSLNGNNRECTKYFMDNKDTLLKSVESEKAVVKLMTKFIEKSKEKK